MQSRATAHPRPRDPMALDASETMGQNASDIDRFADERAQPMLNFLKGLVTWWNGQTLGTKIFTSRHGEKVGEDDQGNIFYRSRDGKRRWVIYNGETEASRVSPDWHGWLHHTWDEPPSEAPVPHKAWEKPHLPNLTGTTQAYAPAGSIRRAEPEERRDYEAWSPE